MDTSAKRPITRGWLLRQFLFWLWLTLVMTAALEFDFPAEYDYQVGDVASQDIRAPYDDSFVSVIRTERERNQAVLGVAPHYTSPDPSVSRRQYSRARAVLTYLRALRADPYGTDNQRLAWVWAVPELSDLQAATANSILTLPESNWNRVQLEFLNLLDQVMREEEIREEDLPQMQRQISYLVPLDMAQDEAQVAEELVFRFVRPNVFYDEVATQSAREAARAAEPPLYQRYSRGEVIVREGDAIEAEDMEALAAFGLTSQTQDWRHWGAAGGFAGITVLCLGIYLWRLQPEILRVFKSQVIVALLLTIFLVLAWLLIRSGELLPYLFPGAAVAMLLATTVGTVPAIGGTVLLSVACGWIDGHSLRLAAVIALGGIYAILTLPRYEQTGPLFRSGLLNGAVQALIIFVFSIEQVATEPFTLLFTMAVSMLGGVISGGLTVGGLFLLTPLFDLTTTFRLMELSRPNHPLMQRLLREAPATFNHIMMVASLAEQAAERIGANALLTRVGAYYHDIGKLNRPYFYSENQQGVSNPHDRLDPYTSVDVLVGHVREGVKMAQKYRLPGKVRAFIPEHHGTMRVSFFYQKAIEAAGGEADLVDEEHFRYPGPAPQSRETLLVMLADGSEAATRARRPSTPEELENVIDYIFEQRIEAGQLDECPITMAELHIVKQTYVELLRGAFHPRVKYPEPKTAAVQAPEAVQTPVAEPRALPETHEEEIEVEKVHELQTRY